MNSIEIDFLISFYDRLAAAVKEITPDLSTITDETPFPNIDFTYPDWVEACFPRLFVFYREKTGKLRKGESINSQAKTFHNATPKVRDQNNFNICACVLFTPHEFGANRRRLKHFGYKHIIAAIPASEKELSFEHYNRRPVYKFKNFHELYLRRGIYDPDLKELSDYLDKLFPCDSTGQLKCF